MEVDRKYTLQAVSWAIVTVMLVVICAGLVVMLAMTVRGAMRSDGATAQYYGRMAWLSLALLALNVVLLAWVVIHYVSGRLARKSSRRPTKYVDAWAIAGQRFKLDEEAEEQEDWT